MLTLTFDKGIKYVIHMFRINQILIFSIYIYFEVRIKEIIFERRLSMEAK